MKNTSTGADKGLFNSEPYTYRSVQVSKDNDTRLSRKDGWKIKQGNEVLYLTKLQMSQLKDILVDILNE